MKAKKIDIITNSEKQTLEVGKSMGKLLKGGERIALIGNLGSGKTVFVKGVAKSLGIKKKITSPTFVLVNRYEVKKDPAQYLYHLDLYRLLKTKDLEDLGLDEMVADPNNIVLIEWAEKAETLLPPGTMFIKFEHQGDNRRKITTWSKK